jgi:hypothetical protein
MNIRNISVLNLEYRGIKQRLLEKGYHYISVVIEYVNDDESLVMLRFQNINREQIIYNSFVEFAKDWNILSDFDFPKPYLLQK